MAFLIPVAAAVVGGLISKSGQDKNAKAVTNAANTQATYDQKAIDENARQFDETQANLKPWLDAGKTALGQQSDLVGLNGAEPQQASIDALKGSPLYQSLYRNGQDSILSAGSATGGLRGGNMQRSLANFGSDTLAQVIQTQLQNLGGLSSAGNTTGTNLGQLGAASATNIGQILIGQGQDRAGGILGSSVLKNNANTNFLQTLLSAAGQAYGGFKGMGGGSAGGGAGASFSDLKGLF